VRKLLLLACLVLFLIFCKLTLAQEAEFDTTYNIEYSIDDSLEVTVKENIAVINQTAFVVPPSFTGTITNISIYDF